MTMQLRHTVRQAQRVSQEAAQELLTQFEPLIRKQIAKYRHRYQSEAEARSTAHSAAMECIYSVDLSRRAASPVRCRPAFTTPLPEKPIITTAIMR